MSSALPYLQKLRKPQLVEFADITALAEGNSYNKPELATALDDHLRENRDIFQNDDRLAEYYRRLAQPRYSSPLKGGAREAKVEVTPPKDDLLRSTRSRRTRAKEEVEATDDSDAASVPEAKSPRTPLQTRSLRSQRQPLPPSPAVVTDAIDHQTAVFRQKLTDAWTASGVIELSNALRSSLSSTKAVHVVILALEGLSLTWDLIPWRYLHTIPPIEAIRTPEFAVKVPDFFVLVDGVFWAPFSLWLLTSFLLPLSVAYFFNISLTASGQARKNRAQASFDPLSFDIAKALISYLVYAQRFTFWDLYSPFSLARVDTSVPGHWAGIITGAAIGGVESLYEAILRK